LERSPSVTLPERWFQGAKSKMLRGDAERACRRPLVVPALKHSEFNDSAAFHTCHLLAGKADFLEEVRKLPYPGGHLKSK
jgi:hypothetical protein